jgi:hypothetical protein
VQLKLVCTMPIFSRRSNAQTTPGGKNNPLRYCAACTRTVNTRLAPDSTCGEGAWCVRRTEQQAASAPLIAPQNRDKI